MRIVALREDIDHRQVVLAEIDGRAAVDAACGDHQAINPLAEQLIEVLALTHRVVGRVAHEQPDATIRELKLSKATFYRKVSQLKIPLDTAYDSLS